MKTLLPAFPALVISIDQVLADEDCVVLRWAGSGALGGEFLGLSPSGKTFSVRGNNVYQSAEGKMIVEHTVWDTLGLLKQLGIISS